MSSPPTAPPLPVGLTSRPPDGVDHARRTGWWVIAAIAIVVDVAVTAKVGLTAVAPELPFDELHPLQLARLLAGDPVPDFGSGGYFPLWGIVLTPLWWIWDDPGTVYRAAAAVGLAVGVATIWPLAAVVRRVGLDRPRALTVAAVVMTLPARAVQADYVLSERLLFLCVALAALAAFRLWERTTAPRAVVFGLAVSLAYLAHVRMVTLVLVSAVWLVALALRRWPAALVGLGTLAVGYLAADWLGGYLNERLTGAASAQADAFLANVQQLRVTTLARVALSQAWAQLVGSFGLVAVGSVAVVVWSWAEVRAGRLGRACWVLGALVAVFLLSTLAWSDPADLSGGEWQRLDPWVYTRYVDPVSGIVVAMGLAALVAGVVRPRVWAWAAAGATAVVLAVVLLVAPTAPTWGYLTPAHAPGVLPFAGTLPAVEHPTPLLPSFTNANRFWVLASVAVLAALVAAFLLRRHAKVVAVGALVLASLATLVADRASDAFRAGEGLDPRSAASLERFLARHDVERVGWDFSCNRPVLSRGAGLDFVGYELLPDVLVERVDSAWDDDPDLAVVLSCYGGTRLQASGALHLPGYELYGAWVWIMPGALQDELLSGGELVRPPAG